jgi:flavin-dependent dehydrogenase
VTQAWRGVLVVGGGVAGAAAAIRLRMLAQPVMLWERERLAHHKICGEFLSAEGVAHLGALGIDAEALGAVPITATRVVGAQGQVTRRLGFVARSLTRHALDAALLARAEALGAEVRRGVTARGIDEHGVVLSAHGDVHAPAVLLATGKHNLRGLPRETAGTIDHLVGFKTYFRLAPAQRAALAGHSEIILFRSGYAGLQMVERDMANLCFLVSPERHAACGGRFDALLADLAAEVPHLARRLDAAVPLLDRPLAIGGVPYGYLLDPGRDPPFLWRLGDQAAVIPSFTGMGMSLALHGAALAVRALMAGEGPISYARTLARDAQGPLLRATALQRLAGEGGRSQARLVGMARALPPLVSLAIRATRLSKRAVRRASGTG